jgi:tRNA-Thr(GGU) m(6)t(6)A37 methyltransferase TsaA
MNLEPIGFIESCYKAKFGTPRQPSIAPASQAILRLTPRPHLQGAFDGLEEFSHIWLIFQFHLNTNKTVRAKVHPPRLQGQKMGIFATRSPHRPNALGLSLVRLLRVEPATLYLSGIDLVDGTPIFDIKPYISSVDSAADARDGWVEQAEKVALEVEFSPLSRQGLAQAEQEHPHFRDLVEQTLCWDPRPLVYRRDNEDDPAYEDVHAVYLHNYDVHFQVKGGIARVLEVIALAPSITK